MRRQDESKKSVILDFIDEYYNEYNEIPAVRTIAEGTGIIIFAYRRRDFRGSGITIVTLLTSGCEIPRTDFAGSTDCRS